MSKYRKKDLDQLSGMFKALSNPHRLTVFLRLASCCAPGTCCTTNPEARACVGDLGKDLGIGPSTVSHHLKELNRSGLVQMERDGQTVQCWVDPLVLESLASFFAGVGES